MKLEHRDERDLRAKIRATIKGSIVDIEKELSQRFQYILRGHYAVVVNAIQNVSADASVRAFSNQRLDGSTCPCFCARLQELAAIELVGQKQ